MMNNGEGNKSRTAIAVGLMSIMLLIKSCTSEVYKVGGEQGWISDTNFGAWSKDFNFTVGDVLLFKYEREQHNVYEVTETAYRTCVTDNGVIAKYNSGNDRVNLSQPKKYWFVCNKVGHCLGGMRFHIDLASSATSAPISSSDVTRIDGWPLFVSIFLVYLVFLVF